MLSKIILGTFLTLSIATTSQTLPIKTIINKTTSSVRIKFCEYESAEIYGCNILFRPQRSYSKENGAILLSEEYPIEITVKGTTFTLIDNNTVESDCSQHALYDCSPTNCCYPAHLLEPHSNPWLTRTLACTLWSCWCCFCFNLVTIKANPQLATAKKDDVTTQPVTLDCANTGQKEFDLVISLDDSEQPVFTFK